MKIILFCFLFFGIFVHAQSVISEDSVANPPENFENVHVEKLFGDSLSTAFMIWVKDTVATHRHNWHSETIHVFEGKAKMYMNGEKSIIKSGDNIFIPKKTWHAVKVISDEPLKVISVQSPGFYGEDREFKKPSN